MISFGEEMEMIGFYGAMRSHILQGNSGVDRICEEGENEIAFIKEKTLKLFMKAPRVRIYSHLGYNFVNGEGF